MATKLLDRRDFTEHQHIKSKLFLYNKRLHLLFIHILCNLYLIINTKNRFKLEIVFMKHCAPNHKLVHKDDITR